MRYLEVFHDALNTGDVCLELGAHFDEVVERLRDGDGQRDGEADETRTQLVAREHGKERRQRGDQIGHQIEAKHEPALGTVGYVNVDCVLVDVLLHVLDEHLLLVVRSDRAHASQRLGEVGEDGRLGRRIQARQLTRRRHKVALACAKQKYIRYLF